MERNFRGPYQFTLNISAHLHLLAKFETHDIFVYGVSSFNDKPINSVTSGPIGTDLFEKEQDDLLSDLKDIPKKACDRRVSFRLLLFISFPSAYHCH